MAISAPWITGTSLVMTWREGVLDASASLILDSNTKMTIAFPIISTTYKIIKKLVPHFGFYPAYLNRSLDHRTGERLLAGFGDDGSERLGVRTWEVPGLLE